MATVGLLSEPDFLMYPVYQHLLTERRLVINPTFQSRNAHTTRRKEPNLFALSFQTGETLFVRDQFTEAVRDNQHIFGLDLSEDVLDRLAQYYELIQQHNPLLHLVGPCTPEEFATRHILESLTLIEFLPNNARFADVGTGAGLPSIPCLIARGDLSATLIESKEKKVNFLRAAIEVSGLANRAEVIHRQFSELASPDAEFVVCRALDRFAENLPRLLKWSRKRKLLLFGGPGLMAELDKLQRKYVSKLLPFSEQRYLIRITS